MGMDWQGDRNPGAQRRRALWAAIEAEFGEPLPDIIQGLREQGNSWRTVAGALGVHYSTLQQWRKALSLPMEQNDKQYDPSSRPPETRADRKAQALGYANMQDAVLDMRLRQKLTIFEVGQRLSVHYQTVVLYTPAKLRREKSIYNRSPRWWQVRRRQIADVQKASVEKQKKEGHPWRE